MKEKKLTVRINKPVNEVFAFTTNPKNTSLWIDSIVQEETNEWPVKIGTIYRNQNTNGDWSEYEVTELKENEMFIFHQKNNDYYVKYVFTPIDDNTTDLEYYEWVDSGNLDKPFTQDILEKLKNILEKA